MIDAQTLPETASQLNDWIAKHFMMFMGPSRAYFEVPMDLEFGGHKYTHAHRVIYTTLAFCGPEGECCKQIAAHLASLIPDYTFEDAYEPIFIRRPFSYEPMDVTVGPYDKALSGRLAFWRHELNEKMRTIPCMKPEGIFVPTVKLPPQL